MLGGAKLTVQYSQEKNCFAYLNSKYNTNNVQAQSIQILWKGKQIMLWAVFTSGVSEGLLSVNPTHSRLLGLERDAEVYVSPYSDVRVLDELYVVPDSPDDQEILEQNAEIIQLNLLDQLRLVVKNQKAVVWVSVSLPIVFTPTQTGLLVNHSAVIVKMDAFLNMPRTPAPTSNKRNVNPDIIKTFNNVEVILDGLLQPYYNPPITKVLRIFPVESDNLKDAIHPYTVFIHKDLVPFPNDGSSVIVLIEVILSVIDSKVNSEEESKVSQNTICAEVIPVSNDVYKSYTNETYDKYIPTVVIPQSLKNILCVESGNKAIFTFISNELEVPEQIQIHYSNDDKQSEEAVIEKFKHAVIESTNAGNTFIINHGIEIHQERICKDTIMFNLRPEKLKYALMKSDIFRNCSVTAKSSGSKDRRLSNKKNSNKVDYEVKNYCRSVGCIEDLVKKVLPYLNFEIRREVRYNDASEIKGNILITGPSGSGKSSLCDILANDVTFWSHKLHCRALRGRKDIPDVLGKAILMCQEHAPSVMFCDDVDALVPADTEGGAPLDIAYFNRLAVVIKNMLRTCSGVCVLLTATCVKSLHPVLREFRGNPAFTAHFDIPELTQPERLEFLKHLVNENVRNDFNVHDEGLIKMAMETSGQQLRDLIESVNKKIYTAVKHKYAEQSEGPPSLMDEDSAAVDSQIDFDIWGPLGGMNDAKQQLTESIFWPMMYPGLFPSQSCGILLFGPPGTGKSFIGSCLAKLKNMNFISVKGPELLSKYIGQSEKGVRDIFDKADMKRPCILFFDEFDSLAPKRGHDSTGVTDRVVTQLLVRLDGAEGGARGPVLAATSRPDLVDPALLRPGRLDIHIYCPLPDLEGRVEVLRTLASSVNVSPAVDVEALASKTDGFSPADLKALLVTAQLTALEKQLETAGGTECVVVGEEEISQALEETRPSLSVQQRLFYATINKRFRGEKLTEEEILQVQQESQKQRVTLA